MVASRHRVTEECGLGTHRFRHSVCVVVMKNGCGAQEVEGGIRDMRVPHPGRMTENVR